ncbi:SRPBCC family protein [Microbulbifer magnicolonia]|uniref:SRPBCC family protein n=1 Tax=Microbulbifer magnicolonia TaxID=3109744 RepID=UPI002B417DBD|nr:SRPBCC family protein [Microbulbifer sp. GG15]
MKKGSDQHHHSGAHSHTTGPSRIDPAMVRIEHAAATVEVATEVDTFFNAYSRWAEYEQWAPDVQGAGHWLVVREGGPGSRFILYDKPGARHLAHFGEVTELECNRRFAWRAPFSEWNRAYIGTQLEIAPKSGGGSRVTETLYFEAREEHLPVVAGFTAMSGFDQKTLADFLEARLRGLDKLIQQGKIKEPDLAYLFTDNRVLAADWPQRVSEGEWVRLLYADGEVDFPASPELVFNVFSRFARYADWTRTIHVGAEWHRVRRGGLGSRFLIWEKPGDRHVMHYATVTEFERNRHFAWRAPFAEWPKVFIGTSLDLTPRADGGTHGYHVIWVDIPQEYLPIFSGFGTLPGIDIEYETWHIQEEVRGINRLIRAGGFSTEDQHYLFEQDSVIAHDWPTETGQPHPYSDRILTLKPDRVLTFEEASVVVTEVMSAAIPNPQFFRLWRDQRRTRQRQFNRTKPR